MLEVSELGSTTSDHLPAIDTQKNMTSSHSPKYMSWCQPEKNNIIKEANLIRELRPVATEEVMTSEMATWSLTYNLFNFMYLLYWEFNQTSRITMD